MIRNTMTRFASDEDIEVCRKIHKQFGTTYYYATRRFPERIQRRVHSIYAFVRVPDEWVDNPGDLTKADQRRMIAEWRKALYDGVNGVRPEHPAMRAMVDTVTACRMPLQEADLFLDAMEADIDKDRYANFDELQTYMRGSASAVGVMMCYAMCVRTDTDTLSRAMALGEAMQLTNFLRDIKEDLERGRIYMPQDELASFGLTESDLKRGVVDDRFVQFMQFQIRRARELFEQSDAGIDRLPPKVRPALLISRILYSRILDRIEAQNYDVFSRRARTSGAEKLACAVGVLIAPGFYRSRQRRSGFRGLPLGAWWASR